LKFPTRRVAEQRRQAVERAEELAWEDYVNWVKKVPAEGSNVVRGEPDFERSQIKIHEMDNALKLTLTVLILSLLVGLGITFVGLMYHHHRRYHEQVHDYPWGATRSTQSTP
jgi:hypothetical protein